MLTFKTVCVDEWELDKLDQVVDWFDEDIYNALKEKNIPETEDYPNIVLRIAGRAIVILREMICLSAHGYPEGILSLARTLYEHFITISFFEEYKAEPDFIQRITNYYKDYQVQRCKALRYEAENCSHDSIKAERLLAELTALRANDKSVGKEYWWTGIGGGFEGTVTWLKKRVDEEHRNLINKLHFAYKRACVSVHSNCMGNMIRLGEDPNDSRINTSPSIDGHQLPLWFGVMSFILIVGIVCRLLELDRNKYLAPLNELAIFYQNGN